MKILVTGAGGYIGTVLVPKLIENGHEVVAVDYYYFGEEKLDLHEKLTKVKLDVRHFDVNLLQGVDVVIDLVAISNDPSGEAFKEITYEVNYRARVKIAEYSRKLGVSRYILPSSCSIYGFHEDEILLDENSPINPLTTYAKANRMAEQEILELASEDFCVTIMRQATIYGVSKRMRFDLAVNAMVYEIWKNGKLPLMRDGKQWRPFLHIEDTTDCMMYLMNTEKQKINGEIFNIGSNEENYQIIEVANVIKNTVNPESIIEWYGDPDHRSYKVDFSKIKRMIGWAPKRTIATGAKEILEKLEKNEINKTEDTITLNWYKKIGIDI
ncbi:NAD-dependent epimerase/dehydratase family protein [Bacillus ndiopicus]|uniref:NAD-dependent epimerase/dehydratase family protein n=1 Tax=Bacillus ndiopicus TaxID=1347368 RepID=UPI0005A8E6EF|nr:NAD(P)-dependent oxidoreductase [Bacillus ndiopicus]